MRHHPVFDFRPDELVALRALTPDQAMAAAGSTRDALLTRRQLAAIGLGDAAVKRRVARRSLHRRHHGVYVVGRPDLTRRGELRAAVLRAGRTAVLSHRSAAWLLDLVSTQGRIDVTVTRRIARPAPGHRIDLHYTARWRPADVLWRDGLPCTSVERTLADLAGSAPLDDFDRAWNAADAFVLLDVHRLRAQILRGRTGATIMRARLERLDETPPTKPVLEDVSLALFARFDIRPPICQWPLAAADRSGRVDFVWIDERVALEVDGRRWHAIQDAHDRDRGRDLDLREAGFDPHRYVWHQIRDDGPRVARIIAAALAARA